jgi:hypothetical protein
MLTSTLIDVLGRLNAKSFEWSGYDFISRPSGEFNVNSHKVMTLYIAGTWYSQTLAFFET